MSHAPVPSSPRIDMSAGLPLVRVWADSTLESIEALVVKEVHCLSTQLCRAEKWLSEIKLERYRRGMRRVNANGACSLRTCLTGALAGLALMSITATSAWSTPPDDEDVAVMQTCLSMMGYDPGPIDGVIGPRSRQSLSQYAKRRFGHAWRTVPTMTIVEQFDRDCTDAAKTNQAKTPALQMHSY